MSSQSEDAYVLLMSLTTICIKTCQGCLLLACARMLMRCLAQINSCKQFHERSSPFLILELEPKLAISSDGIFGKLGCCV